MGLKQNQQRELKASVLEYLQNLLKENGFEIAERVEKGIAIGVDREANPVPSDLSEETFFFEINAIFKKDYDLEDEIEEYQKKLEKAEQKANGENPKVSVKDLKVSEMSEEDLKALEEKLAKAKIVKEKQGVQLAKKEQEQSQGDKK